MLLLVGPKRLPEVTKFFIQIGSKLRSQYERISNEINNEIGTEEIKKDIFNDMKLQELELEENEDNDAAHGVNAQCTFVVVVDVGFGRRPCFQEIVDRGHD